MGPHRLRRGAGGEDQPELSLLNAREAVAYLVARGLVDPGDVVEGRLSVSDESRRNRNLAVRLRGGAGYFLKQPAVRRDLSLLRREAAVYRLLGARRAGLRAIGPRCHGFDADPGVLVLEALPDARDLRAVARGPHGPPVAVTSDVGGVLARLHAVDAAARPDRPARGPGRRGRSSPAALGPPWVLDLPRPELRQLPGISQGNRRFLGALQGCGPLCAAFGRMRRDWRPAALVHNDARWTNVLVTGSGRGRRVVLVDWELAGFGEPSWDLGCFLAEFLGTWVLSAPFAPDVPVRRLLDLARPGLPALQRGMRGFWGAYAGAAGLAPEDSARRLIPAVRHAGARLVQTAYENLQDSSELSGHAVWLLQLASHLVARPLEAGVRLMGIRLAPPTRIRGITSGTTWGTAVAAATESRKRRPPSGRTQAAPV